MLNDRAFDSKKYIKSSTEEILNLVKVSKAKLYIEFGGKLLDDKHASRVLPGYQEDSKMILLSSLCKQGSDIIFVISAKDILRNRIRGDHKITYEQETFRMIRILRNYKIRLRHLAISMIPPGRLDSKIKKFVQRLEKQGLTVHLFHDYDEYETKLSLSMFDPDPFINLKSKIICIISPGGGSGKFRICLSQLHGEMKRGKNVDYLKLETFPVRELSDFHPVNLAFMAASADFFNRVTKNKVILPKKKDLPEKEKLTFIANKFPTHGAVLRRSLLSTTRIKSVSQCFVDEECIEKEAAAEIGRRMIRYKYEIKRGQEKEQTLHRMKKIIMLLCKTS